MKLLSINVEGHARGGILLGETVLDVTGLCEILEQKGEWVDRPANPTPAGHTDNRYQDALALWLRGAGWLQEMVSRFESDRFLAEECKKEGALLPLEGASLNPPVIAPEKILAVGLNYAAHAAEQNITPPEFPLIFSKCVTALAAHDSEIILPEISDKVDYEAELAFVIGREARSVGADAALDYVAGYMIMNDVTARDLQKRENQWVRAKGLDSFAPCGPWLVTGDEIGDPHTLDIQLRVNGELRQSSNTNDLIFKLPQLIEFISQDLTLRPGDIITTGTPSGVGVFRNPPVFLKAGDQIEVEIERIGRLANRVVNRKG